MKARPFFHANESRSKALVLSPLLLHLLLYGQCHPVQGFHPHAGGSSSSSNTVWWRRKTTPFSSSLPRFVVEDDDSATLFSVQDTCNSNAALPDNTTTAASVSTTMPLISEETATGTASFGDVVRPRYMTDTTSTSSNALPTFSTTSLVTDTTEASFLSSSVDDDATVAAQMRRRNLVVAVASVAVAIFNYVWQFTHPISPVQLLVGMQETSPPVSVIGQNGKPTVVDFWAPWCENCKFMAPTLLQVEENYKDKVNFVMVNGDTREAWPLIEAFGVDAIPHMALVSADGDVETALIGPIPRNVLSADLDVLLSNAKRQPGTQEEPIPYVMLDVFANRPDARRVHFDP